IVSVNGREKKIAILDNGKVTEFYIERGEEGSGVVGNIYKGKVMRVLPGMQSAFVEIGLERDAFLYVSDFFDEEEEIERIVMEKSKKSTPEEAKREANERIDQARVEREKQMEAVQEIAEPLVEGGELVAELSSEGGSVEESTEATEPERKSRRRGRKGRSDGNVVEAPSMIEYDAAGFERIVDDEDTGEMFKDAYRQEAIVDKVRAVEFDMESTAVAEVGSLMATVGNDAGGFERIADEDESEDTTAKGKPKAAGRASKAKTSRKAKPDGDVDETSKKKARGGKSPSKGRTKKSKSDDEGSETSITSDVLENAEASVREPDENAAMSVRRGGRGRRRGGRGRRPEKNESETGEPTEGGEEVGEAVGEAVEVAAEPIQEAGAEDVTPAAASGPRDDSRGRGRGGKSFQNGKRNDRNDRRERGPQPGISDLLREGQEIIVQIAKEPIARKGARITSHIALPGRFLVYMPTIEHLGVSRKIESANERGRLRTLIQRIRQDATIPSGGFIVRTAGVGISEEDLRNDAKYLVRTWQDIRKSSEKVKSPALVHQDLDLVQRILRDQLSDEFTAIRVDSEDEYLRTVEFVNRMAPRMVNRVKLYTRDEPILEAYNVQEEIDKALKPRVWLRSGGYLVLNQTEALVAIDVNTGKFVGKGNARLEDTITKTNLEAVDEIARQIRLRDLGGIIVLDLIDMEDRRNRMKVSQALQEALASDKSPTKVLSFNDFGLIIMTRKRVKQSLERTMCAPCDYCEGAGWVKSASTVCYEILSEARRLSKSVDDVRQTTLRVHPDVAKALRNNEREVMEEIEAYLGNVDLSSDVAIHQAQFDFAFV
ncbi:MAG: Rne/Rng family ribonuclease, partial [Acidobacteriota bacterium]